MGRRPLFWSALGFLLLLAVTWWVVRDREREPAESFFRLRGRNPDTLTVAYGPDTTVVVNRSEREWLIIRPVEYPADPSVVGGMISQLADLEVDRVFPLVPEKMDTYGMRFPRGWIRLAYRGGLPPDTLIVGGFAMGGSYDYLRVGSRSEVGMIRSRITRSYFLKSTLDIRETRLLPFYEPGVVGLELLGPEGDVLVELRGTRNSWRVVRPFPGPGDPGKIGEYLKSLNHMHIEVFAREGDGPLEPYGLDHPVASARIVLGDGQIFGLGLGTFIPDTDLMHAVTRSQPHVLGVSRKYLAALERPASAFRRAAPVSFGPDHVDSVHVVGGRGERTFRPGREGDPDLARTLDQVLGKWILLRADDYEPATPSLLRRWGLAPPRGTLVWMGEADTLAVVDIGEPDGNRFPIRISGGRDSRIDEILLVSEGRATPLWGYLERTAGVPESRAGDSSPP